MKLIKLISILACSTVFQLSFCQKAANPWTEVEGQKPSQKLLNNNKYLSVSKFKEFALDTKMFKSKLSEAPEETQTGNFIFKNNTIVALPLPNGEFKDYRLVKIHNLDPILEKKFPEIQSYIATNVKDKYDRVRISVNNGNINISTSDNVGDYVIESIDREKNIHKVFYKENAEYQTKESTCGIVEIAKKELGGSVGRKDLNDRNGFSDSTLRIFRLALATTAEHSDFHIKKANLENGTVVQKKQAVLAALNAYLNRVNEVYEREFSVRFQLVADNDKLIYLDTNTDGYESDNASQVLNATQQKTTDIIGEDNFDIGHGLCTAGGGIAGIGVVCSFRRGSAATGGFNLDPNSDSFISVFLHELGHQFGAGHAQNANAQRSNSGSAVELGCGTTIMSYAGSSCSPQVQRFADFYFNAFNHKEIKRHISGLGKSNSPFFPPEVCGVILESNNNTPPTLEEIDNYVIPKGTAFVLTARGSDPDVNDELTYTWEQMDDGVGTLPPDPTNTDGPLFIPTTPNISPTRYFPRLSTILGGSLSSRFEVIPTVAREMNFTVTVRDNSPISGQTDFRDIVVRTVDEAGPFKILTQAEEGLSLNGGGEVTVAWDVAGTRGNGVITNNVSILLSTNGGVSFDTVIKESTINDGSETISLPNISAKNCRFMVKAVGNIFFAINQKSFSIGYSCEGVSNTTQVNIPDTNFFGLGESSLRIEGDKKIEDLEISVNIEHEIPSRIRVDLEHPDGTKVKLWDGNCNFSGGNLNVTFLDEGLELGNNCRSINTTLIKPLEQLSSLNGKPIRGNWKIIVNDGSFDGVSGIIKSWGIKSCNIKEGAGPILDVSSLENQNNSEFLKAKIYPNPNYGTFKLDVGKQIDSSSFNLSIFDLNGNKLLEKQIDNTEDEISVNGISSGVYLLKIEKFDNKIKSKVIKFVVL